MIRNIVFDIGNVVLDYQPHTYLAQKYGGGISKTLYETIFLSGEWLEMDAGLLTPAEAASRFCARKPELAQEIAEVMSNWFYHLAYLEPTVQLLHTLANKGFSLFYLSNMHENTARYIVESYPFWHLFQGGLFSYEVHKIKPAPEIYTDFLSRCNLKADECVFFDDSSPNIEAANALGFTGFVFTNADNAREDLTRLGVLFEKLTVR